MVRAEQFSLCLLMSPWSASDLIVDVPELELFLARVEVVKQEGASLVLAGPLSEFANRVATGRIRG
jgi:hypothetical protein